MAGRRFSREELFVLVWEKPTRDVAKELGVSDVAVGKLCARLQVPKPPRGYWARVRSLKTPRRPPLAAFRAEIDRNRREAARAKAAVTFSKLQQQFYRAALSDLRSRGIAVEGTDTQLGRAYCTRRQLTIQNGRLFPAVFCLLPSASRPTVRPRNPAASK